MSFSLGTPASSSTTASGSSILSTLSPRFSRRFLPRFMSSHHQQQQQSPQKSRVRVRARSGSVVVSPSSFSNQTDPPPPPSSSGRGQVFAAKLSAFLEDSSSSCTPLAKKAGKKRGDPALFKHPSDFPDLTGSSSISSRKSKPIGIKASFPPRGRRKITKKIKSKSANSLLRSSCSSCSTSTGSSGCRSNRLESKSSLDGISQDLTDSGILLLCADTETDHVRSWNINIFFACY